MPYNKPYLPVQGQIVKLQERGMDIPNTVFAEQCLQRVGYYRFSAYYYPYRIPHPTTPDKRLDNFVDNTTFKQISDLYNFDRLLRFLIADAIEKIEIACRTSITLQLGKRGSAAHLDGAMLDGTFIRPQTDKMGNIKPPRHDKWKDKMFTKFRDSKEDFVLHFKKKYPRENPPIWVASELWDYGMTSHILSGLKYDDRKAVAASFGVNNAQYFCSWIRSIGFLRNVCAHHSRVWNKGMVDQPLIPKLNEYPELNHLITNTLAHQKIYATVSILNLLVKNVWPNSHWGERFRELVLQFPSDGVVNITQAGFPANWENEELWR
jgi:abortive infection bacteriophage resistance protein